MRYQATWKELHFGNLRINTWILALSIIEAKRDKTSPACRALSPQKYTLPNPKTPFNTEKKHVKGCVETKSWWHTPQHIKPTSTGPACNRKQLAAVPISLPQQMEVQKKSHGLRWSEEVFGQEMRSHAPCTRGLAEREMTALQKDFIPWDQRPFVEGLAHCPQEIFSENNSAANDVVNKGR